MEEDFPAERENWTKPEEGDDLEHGGAGTLAGESSGRTCRWAVQETQGQAREESRRLCSLAARWERQGGSGSHCSEPAGSAPLTQARRPRHRWGVSEARLRPPGSPGW